MIQSLLEIEAEFLGENINLSQASSLMTDINASEKTQFDKQVKLAQIMFEGFEWFKSADCKQAMEYQGIEMTTEDFYKRVFGYNKSFFYDMVKLGKYRVEQSNIVATYKRSCTNLEAQGEKVSRSVKGFLKFVKDVESGEEAEVQSSSATLMTFSVKGDMFDDGKGASVRVTADGKLHLSGDGDKIPQGVMQSFIDASNNILNA